MIGSGYWSTGITVEYRYAGQGDYGWAAKVAYLDDGFVDDNPGARNISTEGTLHTRYAVRDCTDGTSALAAVIDVIKADAERLGITWKTPAIYYQGDGHIENIDDLPAPEGWRQMLRDQAQRIGWSSGRRYVEEGGSRAAATGI